MSYTAPILAPYSMCIGSLDRLSCVNTAISAIGGAAWPTAHLAIFVPVRVPATVRVVKMGIAGVSSATGNIDLGIYDAGFTRMVSTGPTSKTVADEEVVIDVTDTTIPRGLYYLTACVASTSLSFTRQSPAAPIALAMGVLTATYASDDTLPATASPSADQTLAYIPHIFAFLDATVA